MLNFGTPLTRGEMKQIKGGTVCFDCWDNGGNHYFTFYCESTEDCYEQADNLCSSGNCTCHPDG